MGFRKTLAVLLLSVLGLVIGYNWAILPMSGQNVYRMGMHGMGGYTTVYPNYLANPGINSLLFLILLVLAALLLYDLMRSGGERTKRCRACGYTLRPDWVICPICGAGVSERRTPR
ncbi:MAG: hypothetical protein HPY50_06100 [Firmicutes bacterium]|nr:hypothetical protein [Bacillota bacterium]